MWFTIKINVQNQVTVCGMWWVATSVSVMAVAVPAVAVPAVWWYRHRRPTRPEAAGAAPGVEVAVVVDAVDLASVRRLVRMCERGDGTDGLADRMWRLYDTFPPTPRTVSRLLVLHGEHDGQGGEDEFCIVSVLGVARLHAETARPRLRRSVRKSAPCRSRRDA